MQKKMQFLSLMARNYLNFQGELILKIAIVVAEFNQKITSRMYDVALETAKKLNLDVIHTSNVPGIFDMR